ncbi:MerR family transcriptional regulator [Anaerocolumna sp. AGMB13025]|uniref:MerR family transcriptional regulator n=1 Tax=Anaerocolumna sp. AGMB13025 TaxID=3039116 RepID=UPI00241ECA30|nr:MerR family transcriptional regulator [Anaerocolumna sp. AGMB13025]WFR55784.1 MerR family transcriptional regulator [Anaerocolumna sp. AGMB13025]
MELSVSKMAANFGISRSTLLYYDSINLLKPSKRTNAGYRLYNDADMERLNKIMLFRDAGVPLAEISNLLIAANLEVTAQLLKRLGELNKEIEAAKKRQNIIVKLLETSILYKNLKNMDESTWLAILDSAGIKRETTEEWHSQFEKHSPMQHQNLLELLGFDADEIQDQREHYRNLDKK